MGIAVGIDLGTTYSAVARVDPQTGRPVVIPNRDGDAVTPSVVAVMPGNQVLFGVDAKEQQEAGYTETAAFFKRYMGDNGYTLSLAGRTYTPVDLSSMLLSGLVSQAQEVSGETIDAAYVTVPAYFKNSEREDTLKAARQAGLNVLGLLNEPTAAAFAYGLNGQDAHQTVLVYDLGGGTFDVTLAEVDGDEIRILGSDGSHILGGKDWDDAVARWIADQFEDEFDEDLTEDPEQLAQLGVIAENAKKRLSKASYADVTVHFDGRRGQYRLDRETFDSVTSYMLQETSDIVDRLFASFTPSRSWHDVDGAILVGGSTRMLQVHDYIERMSGKKPLGGVNVDEAVALGAAIRANQDAAGRAVAPSLLLSGGAAQPQSSAPGMLLGGRKVTDATSHALGMISESADRSRYVNDILIPKNSAIPAENTQRRELRVPREGGEMEVYLLQGSEDAPLDNEVAGKYVFRNIPYVNNGRTLIDVTYRYDENGVIDVSAKQSETGTDLRMEREPVPEDMSWVLNSPKDNDTTTTEQGSPQGEILIAIDTVIVDGVGQRRGQGFEDVFHAAAGFVEQIDMTAFAVSLMLFTQIEKVIVPMTHDKNYLRNTVLGVPKHEAECVAMTENGQHFSHPYHSVPACFSSDAPIKVAIVLSDGIWGNKDEAIQCARLCNGQGIETISIGFGAGDPDFMRRMSSIQDLSGITTPSGLSESFSKIARVINTGSGLQAG